MPENKIPLGLAGLTLKRDLEIENEVRKLGRVLKHITELTGEHTPRHTHYPHKTFVSRRVMSA